MPRTVTSKPPSVSAATAALDTAVADSTEPAASGVNDTIARAARRLTRAPATPGTSRSIPSALPTHAEQVMPPTVRRTSGAPPPPVPRAAPTAAASARADGEDKTMDSATADGDAIDAASPTVDGAPHVLQSDGPPQRLPPRR